MPWTPPILTTPRLMLRPLTLHDVDALYEACSNPRMTEFTVFETHANRATSEAFIRDYVLKNYSEAIPDCFGVALKETPERILGCAGGRWTESRCNRSVEFGYWIAEPHWGQGFATEAVTALVPYLFESLKPVRVQAHVMAPNLASARVLEKAGLEYEGTLRKAVFRSGVYWDVRMYSTLASRSDAV